MSKRELIDAILQHNRTAAPEFLAKFQEYELKAYLERVSQLHNQIRNRATAVAPRPSV
jgi:hypothetical protein